MINANERKFDTIRKDLHASYGQSYSAEEIDAKLDEVIARHTASATLEEYVPVMVEREVKDYFGEHRMHVRFSAGTNHSLAQAAVALTRKHAGNALHVDAAVAHPEHTEEGHMAHVLGERGMGEQDRNYLDEVRTVSMPDFIVYLGRELPRDEAGKDIKIWDIPQAESLEETRDLADDLEARVLYMLNRLGIEPITERESVDA